MKSDEWTTRHHWASALGLVFHKPGNSLKNIVLVIVIPKVMCDLMFVRMVGVRRYFAVESKVDAPLCSLF